MNIERIFKKHYKLFVIITILLAGYLIIPNGTKLPPVQIIFEEGVYAELNKPLWTEILAFVVILIFVTICIYLIFIKHKKIGKT